MSDGINILIVEDNAEQIQIYNDSIDSFNKESDIPIHHIIKNNFSDSIMLLNRHIFDAAIIDIKLAGTDIEGDGNKVIRAIKNRLRFPIYVISGYIAELDEDLQEQNVFYKIYERDKISYIEAYKDIYAIYKTGLTNILGGRGVIENYLTHIFWKNLADSYDLWLTIKDSEKLLLRYTLMHVVEFLNRNECGEFELYHPNETYIIPPIDINKILTGDILKDKRDSISFIVLTPLCDFAYNKAERIIICQIESLTKSILQKKLKLIKKNTETEKNTTDVKNIIKNNYSNKYYFLPKTDKFDGGLINFQKVSSLRSKQIQEQFYKTATISHYFIKDIISKFSYYYSRQGSPDYDIMKILKEMLNGM
jgi:CheY-like chemotaxis protein